MQRTQRSVTMGRPGRGRRAGRVVSACVAIAALVAGCGGDDDGTEQTEATAATAANTASEATAATVTDAASESSAASEAPAELTEITIGFPRLAHAAAIPLAVQQGYFEDEGLAVNLNSTIANPAIPAAVVSGDLQAGVTGWSSVAAFATQDLPVRVAVGLSAIGDGTGSTDTGLTLVSLADGGLASAAELEGKTVVMNSLGADPEATLRAIATKAGVDPDSINIQAVDLPEMGPALRAGRADAVVISEPFLTALAAETEITILGSAVELQPNRPGLNVIVSAEYAEENPEIVAGLQRALARAAQYATDHPEAVRALLVDEYEFAPEIAEQVALPDYVAFPDAAAIQQVPQALADFGLIDEVPDMSTMVLAPPEGLDATD